MRRKKSSFRAERRLELTNEGGMVCARRRYLSEFKNAQVAVIILDMRVPFLKSAPNEISLNDAKDWPPFPTTPTAHLSNQPDIRPISCTYPII